jgi:hypothetical protein
LGDVLGTAGVALLLAAFLANVAGWLRVDSRAYQSLNLAGAGLACVASYLIEFWPFVVLEAVWALVAALALIRGRPATVS